MKRKYSLIFSIYGIRFPIKIATEIDFHDCTRLFSFLKPAHTALKARKI